MEPLRTRRPFRLQRRTNLYFSELSFMLVLWSSIDCVRSYNLDLTVENAKFMTSPVLQAMGKDNPDSRIPELDPNVPPSFYGYQMSFTNPSPSSPLPQLMVGAPKMTDPSNPNGQRTPTKPEKGKSPKFKPHGAVKACPVRTTFFRNGPEPTCTPANPEPTQEGDGFGSALTASPDGKISACSPSRALDCSVDKYNPGFCYKSENYGSTYNMDSASENAACPSETVDVVFVLDGSGSIYGQFDKVKKWVKNIVKQLESQMATGYVQVGVIQYSHYFKTKNWDRQRYIKTEIEVGRYSNYREFAEAVDAIKHQNYTTWTGHALEKVVGDFNSSSRFGKPNNNQMMLLMTDGKSDDSELVAPNAKKLRDMGVTTYAVGVGKADKRELRQIATGTNTNERVYSVSNFNELDSLVNRLKSKILNFVLEGGTDVTNASYKMEFAQTGFSSAFQENTRSTRTYLKLWQAQYSCI